MKSKVYFWTLVAGYPSHHPDLPPNTEAEFTEALINGGYWFSAYVPIIKDFACFLQRKKPLPTVPSFLSLKPRSTKSLPGTTTWYVRTAFGLKNSISPLRAALRSQGWNTTKHLAWLMGAVMPLDAVGRRIDDQRLATMMNGIHS